MFLSSDRTFGRKAREALIAFWLEAWLTKDQILERYLSNVYFGDNVYGLRAASLHYFNRQPERLTIPQAAMLVHTSSAHASSSAELPPPPPQPAATKTSTRTAASLTPQL